MGRDLVVPRVVLSSSIEEKKMRSGLMALTLIGALGVAEVEPFISVADGADDEELENDLEDPEEVEDDEEEDGDLDDEDNADLDDDEEDEEDEDEDEDEDGEEDDEDED